jgi:hypothetical protein
MLRIRRLDIYPLSIGYVDDQKQFINYCKRRKISTGDGLLCSSDGSARFHSWGMPVGLGLIAVNPDNMRDPLAFVTGLIAHEVQHCWDWIYWTLGEHERGGREASAYLQAFMVRFCMQAYMDSMKERGWRINQEPIQL